MDVIIKENFSALTAGSASSISIYLIVAIVVFIVLLGIYTDKQYKWGKFIKWFSASLAANVIMLVSEAGLWFFDGNPDTVSITKLCTVFSFCSGYLVAVFFAFCLVEFVRETAGKISYTYAHIISVTLLLLSVFGVIGIFNEIIIYFDETGTLRYSPYYMIVYITNFLVFSSEIIFVFYYKVRFGKNVWFLSCFGFLAASSMIVSLFWDTVPVYLAVSFSLLIMNNIFRNEISKKLVEREKQIAENRVANLINQIQPHFIFNTLNAIKYLCKTDVSLARRTIDSFAVFLRGIIESAESARLVTIEREIEITEHYIFIEKQRFGDLLTLSTDLKEKDFFLPMLTIQPIVENSVKHGIRKKNGKGNILISTFSDDNNFFVKICDDGVGFDVNNYEVSDGKHVGIKNVSERIQLMTKGRLNIESIPGDGTTVIITIPKK